MLNLRVKTLKWLCGGHLFSLIGSILIVIFGILDYIDGWISGTIGFLAGIFILVIELGKLELPFLKDSLIRGIVWIVLAVIAGIGEWFPGLAVLIGGILYLVYALSY
jgi:hypothetical protein